MTRCWLAVTVLLAGCATAPVAVQHVGVMREVMREGRTEARAKLADHATAGTFGVGALTDLGGEILIDDGVAWVAVDAPLAAPAPPAATATLLTTATVQEWQEVLLVAAVDTAALAQAIAGANPAAVARGEVVPFVLEGRGRVQLHVVRGACPHGDVPPGHEPARWSAADVALRCVGFHAQGQEGVMTHMGTPLHVHAFATDERGRRVMGHVDDLALQPGAVLRLPRDSW